MTDDVVARALAVLSEVAQERQHQVEDLGFDAEHDARMGRSDFGWLLARRAVELCAPAGIGLYDDDARRLLIEVAAIAVAAIEVLDSGGVAGD